MRIRKCASKLLGLPADTVILPSLQQQQQQNPPCFQPPVAAPPPFSWTASRVTEPQSYSTSAEALCQLNFSPWDVMSNLQLSLYFQEEEQTKGIMVNNTKAGKIDIERDDARGKIGNNYTSVNNQEEPLSVTIRSGNSRKSTTTTMVDQENKRKEKITKKLSRSNKQKERIIDKSRDSAASSSCSEGVVLCKKSDGKGWQCKRPAQLPHNLCQYHILQVRSYSGNPNNARSLLASADSPGMDASQSNCRSARRKTSNAGIDNSYYYYYSGFGPWRGKDRGIGISTVAESGDDYNNDNGDEHADDAKAFVAADDEDFEVAGNAEENIDEDSGEIDGDKYVEEIKKANVEQKMAKKRGRKPMKARSLKSLL